MSDGVTAVLEEVSETMLDDGVELQLEELGAGVARVRLEVDPVACEECVVPGAVIESILLPRLQEQEPSLERVQLVGEGVV
jgi:hypothetical protein